MKNVLTPQNLTNGRFSANQPTALTGFAAGAVIDSVVIYGGVRSADADYLLRVDSPGITIKCVEITGGVSTGDGKADWMRNAANGMLIIGDNVTVEHFECSNVHTGATLRGSHGRINGGLISVFSGDGLQLVADGCEVAGVEMSGSIEVFPYDQFHRDLVQLWKYGGGTLTGCVVRGIRYNAAHYDKAPPPQGICGFDGEYENIRVEDCQLQGIHPEHGVSFGCAHNTVVTGVTTDAAIRFGGRKRERKGQNNIVTNDCVAKEIRFEDGSGMTAAPKPTQPTAIKPKDGDMDQVAWLAGLRNTNAPAIVEENYAAAAARLNCEVAAIKAVFTVESAGSGYNADGSVKCLYERHIARREVRARKLPYDKIANLLGDLLISRWTGGYKGGIAEYWRIGQAVRGIAQAINAPDPASLEFPPDNDALEVSLRATSWGRPQILGKNCELAGYSTAVEMVEAFHKSEKAHLDAFVSFVENTGLDKFLRNQDWLSFAKGYNGKSCCDKGGKKDYSALIAAEYRRLSNAPIEFKPLSNSRTIQGGVTAVAAGGTGIVTAMTELKGVVADAMGKLEEAKSQAADIAQQVGDVKAQAAEVLANNIDLLNMVSDMQWWVYALAGVLTISLLGNAYALYARWDDRRNGRN